MPPADDWSKDRRGTEEERRRILERRRQARRDAADAAADAANPAPAAKGKDRRTGDRRKSQICFVCRSEFVPKANGQVICAECQLDGVRGSAGRTKSRF